MVLQARVPLFPTDTVEDIAARVQVQEHAIYPLAVVWFCHDRVSMHGQQAWLDGVPLPPQGYACNYMPFWLPFTVTDKMQ